MIELAQDRFQWLVHVLLVIIVYIPKQCINTVENLSDDKHLQLTALKIIEQFNPPGIVCFELCFLLTSIFQTMN